MQPNSEAATAALELEHYFESGTYGHAAALAMDSATPVVEPAPHSNLAEREDARYVVTDLGRQALNMEAPFGLRPTVVETQRSA